MSKRIGSVSGRALMAMLVAAGAAPAWGQESAALQAEALEEVVVTGYRSANQDAINVKRASDAIVDAESSDSIGLLPDLDITQVAQRIPGLSVISTFGAVNDRSSDDSEAIVIRGLSPNYNLTMFDGAPIASADENDRRTKTGIIPPSIVARVEAIKTMTADRDPHALSGQMNLVTESAFDRGGPYLTTRLSVGRNSTAGEMVDDQGPDIRADARFSTTFGDGRFGVVAAGSYHRFYSTNWEEKPGVDGNSYLFYRADPASNSRTTDIGQSNGFPASRRNQIFAFQDDRERISGVLKLEYRPSDATEASLFLGHFQETEIEDRWEYLVTGNESNRPLDQTATGGRWRQGRAEPGYVYQPEETTADMATATLTHRTGERGRVRAALSASRARLDVIRDMYKLRPSSVNALGAFAYDLSSGRPRLTFENPEAMNDLSRYESNYLRARTHVTEQDLRFGRLDYDFNMERGARGWGFNVGASATTLEQTYDAEYREGDVFDTEGCAQTDITRCPYATLDRFVLPTTLAGLGTDFPFYLIDGPAFRAAWEAQGSPLTSDTSDDSVASDYRVRETLYGLYGQAAYRGERFSVRAGLRYDRAEIDADLWARDDALTNKPNDAARYRPISRASSYDHWLPSAIGSYELSDNLVLRAGYGRTVGRPDWNDYAREERIGEPEDGEVSIRRGNPDLKPRTADNYDLSLEYYFNDRASLISAAVFHKDVRDMIYVQDQIIENYEMDGQVLRAVVSQPVNASEATIRGIELAWRQDFARILPAPFDGLLLNANLTWMDGEVTVLDADGVARDLPAWEKQPEFLFNLQVSYERGPFSARVAYNYVDDYLNNVNEESAFYDVYRSARSEVDFQMRYRLNRQTRLLFEVQNVGEEGVESVRRFPFGDLLAQDTQKGRRVWLGFTWTPSL